MNWMMLYVKGQEILVARVGDNYYSVDNRCPHMGGNLSKGNLEGTIVTCPNITANLTLQMDML